MASYKFVSIFLIFQVLAVHGNPLKWDLDDGSLQVKTGNGIVEGKIQFSRNGREFYSFEGIPYAKPPSRFERPEPVENWDGVYDATYPRSVCPQFDPVNQVYINETEDCLYLNVHVPQVNGSTAETDLPVMFWIHGGGFLFGAGSDMGPSYFMDEDIILVTINYRLGVFGFLNTGDEFVTGNMGIRDMILALKWTHANVASFGGDPEKITIFGESAGAAAVHSLMISPLSSGMIYRAIAQSGSMLTPWSFNKDTTNINSVLFDFANCKEKTMEETVKCLKEKPLGDLLEAVSWMNSGAPFVPTLDAQVADAVFPKTPRELVESGDHIPNINFIVGFNEREGLGWALGIVKSDAKIRELNEDWTAALNREMGLQMHLAPGRDLNAVALEIKDIYLGGNNVTKDNLIEITNIMSDFNFIWASKQTAILHGRQNAQVFPYMFTYRGNFSLSDTTGYPPQGPSHADDLQYLFQSLMSPVQNWPDLAEDSEDEEFSKNLVSLWTSFAVNGQPSSPDSAWSPVNPEDTAGSDSPVLKWFNINAEPEQSAESPEMQRRLEFWNRVYLPPSGESGAISTSVSYLILVVSLFTLYFTRI